MSTSKKSSAKKVRKPETEAEKQVYYRDARSKGYYGDIWTSTGKCVFCDLREKYVLFEEDGMVLVVSLFAYIDGDLMIVSRRHIQSASDMTQAEWEATRKLMHISRKLIKKTYGIKGLNFVQRHGGPETQSTVVGHYHIKVIPFDAADLVTWHYRDLKHTPLENVDLIKANRKHLIEQSVKFDTKYSEVGTELRFEVTDASNGTTKSKHVFLGSDDNALDVQFVVATELFKKEPTSMTTTAIQHKKVSEKVSEPHLRVAYPKINTVLTHFVEARFDE